MVNISILTNYTQIYPKYYLNCQRANYISYFNITNVEWVFDLSNSSYYKDMCLPYRNTTTCLDSSYTINNKDIFEYWDYNMWVTVTDKAKTILFPYEQIPITIIYTTRTTLYGNNYKLKANTILNV